LKLNGLSQANMYGDDCNPSTNYPLVRLRETASAKIFFARTHHFSGRGITTATATLPQSVEFSAAHIPYGHYELSVVTNGISSQSLRFHHHPHHHACCGSSCRHDCDCQCRDCKCRDVGDASGPENVALHQEVRRLSRAVDRLSPLIKIEPPHREMKEITKDTSDPEKG